MTILKHGLTHWLVSLSAFISYFQSTIVPLLLAISVLTAVLAARGPAVSGRGPLSQSQLAEGKGGGGRKIRNIIPFQKAGESQGLWNCWVWRLEGGLVSEVGWRDYSSLSLRGNSVSPTEILQQNDVSRMIPCSLSPGFMKKNGPVLIRGNKILFMLLEMKKP